LRPRVYVKETERLDVHAIDHGDSALALCLQSLDERVRDVVTAGSLNLPIRPASLC
jgi:hypothetical protein